ncbi:MAG: hypothetical protein ABUL63_05395, partial [Acidobacteriota bacterium]
TELAHLITPETRAGDALMEHTHESLCGKLAEIERLLVERASHEARKQEATRKIGKLLDEGRRTATLLRKILQQRLGPTSEELAAFKIQPFRGRKRSRKKVLDEDAPQPTESSP